ncbi:hypothetical protein ASPWEDRAFT_23497 [Aspergillus wentii DTO 134E9]|uniref:Filamentation protein n=1 Tax=Aspergillus wentii DTO 134E9 TaxID=1073089 RepID=A0A1L9S2L4_ASPWE|nr:uncharacterized protein ASPWEDRAFT_23497 [Aspergillus wentii DTO 134E9]OJJ41404.1 hypothetical protein ASPWEDRAFT_23497 [Aspergillus wentii DTO 134E9]
MAGRDLDKGHRYIAALDNARCQDKWDEIPELIRKVTKHASQKTCFLDTVNVESQVAAHVRKRSNVQPSSPSTSNLSELIPSLLSTIEKADGSPQEVFQAQVCLGWVHWTLNEPGLAVARLPKDFGATVSNLSDDGQELSPWTEVCLVKGCYIKGTAQSMASGLDDALQTFKSLMPWLSSHSQASLNNPQLSHWSEKLLAQGALLSGDEACMHGDDERVENALKFFRLWSAHPNVKGWVSPNGAQSDNIAEPASKSAIWKGYYDLLTTILQYGLTYVSPTGGSERPQLASELRRVESVCESSLLREVKFPKAESLNSDIEDWVEQVIQNWEVLCGPQWRDEDLGEGGQNAVGRNVLDILYKAATKTYHSHLILRRLFHVHSALADFDLALKALDAYIEIVTGAKARAEKGAESGELENDGRLLQTLSEGVTMLCCFGPEKGAEKARDLTVLIKRFLGKHTQVDANDQENDKAMVSQEDASSSYSDTVSPSVTALAYRAIGVGLANWAYWTPVNEERDDIRAEAIEYLEKSLAPELGDEYNYSSLYTLSLLLAEDRDLDGAIDYVKSALTSNSHPTPTQANLVKERDLVALWHLLALLLSAKQDFGIAERSCEAAFEQFPSAVASLNHGDKGSHRQPQDHEQSTANGLKHALIDQLRGREKERIIETRMTQLAFVEVLEGPEAAVNHSDQLLSLFATLFQNLELESGNVNEKNTKTEHLVPPQSSAGTVRSFRGSIFGRNRGPRAPERKVESAIDGNQADSVNQAGHPFISDAAPAIQVTDEDKKLANEGSHPVARSESTRQRLRKRSSTLRKSDAVTAQGDGCIPPVPSTTDANGTKTLDQTSKDETTAQDMVGLAVSGAESQQAQDGKQPLRPMAHNVKYNKVPPPVGHEKQPPEQDVRLPISYRFDSPTNAVVKFPIAQAQKHALGILIKVWLLVAGLYRRASLFEDANEACEEAFKQVTRIEALVAAQDSSAKLFSERSWGTAKSSEELWADYYAEQAQLSKAQSRPREAMERFERALIHYPDHPKATIGLASLLLDIWDQKFTADSPPCEVDFDISTLSLLSTPQKKNTNSKQNQENHAEKSGVDETKRATGTPPVFKEEEPKYLNRLAARDRAFGLLSTLTKRGSSWDNSEAWYALSRAYEAGGQIGKLKEVLWWCIELEDRRPIRHWSNIGSGVYVL